MGLLLGIGNTSYYSGYNVVSTLENIPVDKRLIVATLSESAALTLSGDMADGRELLVIINNTSDSAISVGLPDSDLEIAGGESAVVSVIYAGKYYCIPVTGASGASGSVGAKVSQIALVNGGHTVIISLDEDGYVHVNGGLYADAFLSVGGSDVNA